MTQAINTSNLSLITQNNINRSQSTLSSSIERLSSGLRINSAEDDAADQTIANRFTSSIKGLAQAVRNANDGISVAQIAEGALPEINSSLQRIRELTVQASTGTSSDLDLDSVQDEVKSRLGETDHVPGRTQFSSASVPAEDGSVKIQVGVSDGETTTIDLKEINSDTLGLNGFNVDGRGTITNRAATVSDLTSASAKLSAAAGLYDLKTENTLLTTDIAFDRLGNDDKATVGGVDYTYNTKSGDFTTTESTAGTDVDAAAQATDSAKKRDALAATLHADMDKSVNGSYITKDGTVSFETDPAGNITIGGGQAYVDNTDNLTTNNAGNTAKAGMKALLRAANESSDSASLTFNGTEYTVVEIAPATTSPVAPLIPGGITYQATANKDVVLSEAKAVTATSLVTLNSGVLSRIIGFTTGESSDVAKSHADGKGGITSVADYTVSYSANKDNGSVTIAGYASVTGTSKDYAPVIGTAINVNSTGRITTETTNAGFTTTNPFAVLDDTINSIDELRSSLGAIRNRLDSAVINLNNTTTNLSKTQSRVQDVDYATEVPNMSEVQIVQQADNSTLAEANQVPQQVLSLLQG